MFWTKKNPRTYISAQVRTALERTFNEYELEQLAQLGTLVDIAEGDKLTVEGTTGRQALIVIEGTASVLRGGEPIATVGTGDIVGEVALLSGEPRTATVVADTDMTVYAMSAREFASLLSRCPRLANSFTKLALRRLTEAAA